MIKPQSYVDREEEERMAKYEQSFEGDFDQLLQRIEDGILNGSMSASLEDSSDFSSGESRCASAFLSGTVTQAETVSA